MSETRRDGLTHLYYGSGKGKTTAAMGLAIRAAGHGLSVSVIQFMKGAAEMRDQYGEVTQLRDEPGIDIEQFPVGHVHDPDDLSTEDRETLDAALDAAATAVADGSTDLVVLDEVLTLYDLDVASGAELVDLIQSADDAVEIVLTGRNAPPSIVDEADYVTRMAEVKHPFRQDVGPRAGIEY